MEKQKNGELSRMFGYAGKFHVLTVLGCVLSGISTILSMLPFVCIWLVIRDLIQAFAAGDISLATGSAHYAWMAVVFAAASILIYFIALNCTHLAAFRTATNMRKSAIHHIVTLPLGYFSQNASGRLRNIIDDNAGLTEGFLAHQLPDLTGAAVMPVAVIILIFLFDWRLGICCLIPMGISVIFLKQMMGGDNAQFMGKYMTALETMNKAYVNDIITTLGLEHRIHNLPNTLSGGQQQRVAIARALVNRPEILFADEPTGNLDSKTSDEVIALLKMSAKKYGQTIVMITHDDEIAQVADRILVIEDGQVVDFR